MSVEHICSCSACIYVLWLLLLAFRKRKNRGDNVSGGGSLPGWWQDGCVFRWMRNGWIGGRMSRQTDSEGEWVRRAPNEIWKCFIFYNRTGFSDRHPHSSAFSFGPVPIETSGRNSSRLYVCVCAWFGTAVCVCVWQWFINVCLFSTCFSNPLTNKRKNRHLNKTVSHSNHSDSYCWSGRLLIIIISQSQATLWLLWLL